MQQSEYGLVAATDGWFTVNVRDAAWVSGGSLADACIFEGDAVPFGQIGYTLAVLAPGQAAGMYHREDDQEDFLVLSGECLLIVEDQERRLQAWDFVHCPPGTEHVFVGAGNSAVRDLHGRRPRASRERRLHPLRDGAAPRRRASRPRRRSRSEAYAPFAKWQPGPPASFDGLPWG